jgi:formate dehydrogenase subunit delta
MTFIDTARLVTMANQIGDFFAPYPPARRIEGVRNHLRNYWDPRMREALFEHIDATGGADLLEHVREAAELVRADTAGTRAYAGPPKASDPAGS